MHYYSTSHGPLLRIALSTFSNKNIKSGPQLKIGERLISAYLPGFIYFGLQSIKCNSEVCYLHTKSMHQLNIYWSVHFSKGVGFCVHFVHVSQSTIKHISPQISIHYINTLIQSAVSRDNDYNMFGERKEKEKERLLSQNRK